MKNSEKSPDEEVQGSHFLQVLNNIIDGPKESDQSTSNDEQQQTEFKKSAQRASRVKPVLKKSITITDDQEVKKKEYPRVKKIDPEVKKLEESIAKAPHACQTTLKVINLNELTSLIGIDLHVM